jgi:hypothetical protein
LGRDEMKYMIMTFGDTSGLEGKSPEWIKEMIEFMHRIDVELTQSGELVFSKGSPSRAKPGRSGSSGASPWPPTGRSPSRGSRWWGSGS